MKLNLKIIPIAAVILIIIFTGIYVYKNNFSMEGRLESIAKLPLPDGWYSHKLRSNSVIFTQQKELPDIGNTEGYGYGKQIGVGTSKIDTSPEEWAAINMQDDPLIISKTWDSIGGYKVLKAEQYTEADEILAYYIFTNDYLYFAYLYPIETYDSLSKKNVRDMENLKIFEQIVDSIIKII